MKRLCLILFLTFPLLGQDCYESSIVKPSPFMGNNGEIFKLADGSMWEVKYEYEYMYEYYPSVLICPSKGSMLIGGKSLNVQLIAGKADSRNPEGWEVFEETNIEGVISGIVKRGHIFKTISGNYYEITGITIQVVVEVMPDVMVLKKGDTYKLIVEGFDEPLLCKCIKCSSVK